MEMRPLGRSGLKVAPLVFGGNVFGWTVDDAAAFALLDAFVEGGGNMIDSADGYPHWAPGCEGGESEAMIGRWLARRGQRVRERVLIATKSGKWKHNRGLSPAALKHAVDTALQRLQTDCIDLFQAHAFDPDVPLADTLGTYGDLMQAGKIRAIGASNFSPTQLADALAVSKQHELPRFESLQPQYNLVEREGFEAALASLVQREHIGVISYFSLASGFLTGKYRKPEDLEGRARAATGAGKYLNDDGFRVLDALDEVAGKHGVQPVQVALAWLMQQPGITAPIASATSLRQLHELLAAATLELDAEDLQALDV